MPNLGLDTIAPGNDFNDSGVLVVCGPYAAVASGPLVSGFLYISVLDGAGTRSQAFRMVVIEADITNDHPDTLVGVTDEVLVDQAATVPGWVEFPAWTQFGGAPSISSAKQYFVGPWFGTMSTPGVTWGHVVTGSAADLYYDFPTYSSSGNPPVPPSGNKAASTDYSSYFSYTAGGGSNIASFVGLANASVGTVEGLARASVGTVVGLA